MYRFDIDLWPTAQLFAIGHRNRIEVTSSDFPRFDRNLNTGGPFGSEAHGEPAINVVLHDALPTCFFPWCPTAASDPVSAQPYLSTM